MGNVVGPTWGSEVANILMQGGQWDQQKQLQDDSQSHDKQMRELENLMSVKNEYIGKMFDVITQLGEEGGLDSPAAQPYIQTVLTQLETQMELPPGSLDPKMFAAVLPGLQSGQSKAGQSEARVLEATEEERIRSAELGVESGELGVQAQQFSIDNALEEFEVGMQLKRANVATELTRPDAIKAGTEQSRAQTAGIKKNTGWIDEMAEADIGLKEAQTARLSAEADMMSSELLARVQGKVDPDLLKQTNEKARIRFLGVKKGDKVQVQQAMIDIALMYEEIGAPLPTTLVWRKDDPGLWEEFLRLMGKPDPKPYELQRQVTQTIGENPYLGAEEVQGVDSLGIPRVPGSSSVDDATSGFLDLPTPGTDPEDGPG